MDITGCKTTDELIDAAASKSGFKIDPKFKDLWVVCLMISDIDVVLIASSRSQNLISGPSPKNNFFTRRLRRARSAHFSNACSAASLLVTN